jgi:hypothetical protein
VSPPQVSGTVSRDSAVQIATTHIGGRVDATRAQLMTLGEYINGAGDEPLPGQGPHLSGLSRDDLMWVVTMTGSFGDQGSGVAVVLIDALTGAVVGEDLRAGEPAFFSDLPDRNRHEHPSC